MIHFHYRKLLCSLWLCLSLSGLYAQELKFCILTGPAISWMDANKNVIKSGTGRLGYTIHIQGEYWLTDRYALTAGLGFFLGQGGSLKYLKGGDILKSAELSDTIYHHIPKGSDITYRMNYVDFPFGFKLRTAAYRSVRLYMQIPEFSLSFRTKARGNIEAPPLPYTKDEDFRGLITFINLFYGITIGLETKLTQDISLNGGVRFYQSITDVTNDSGVYTDGIKENSKGILSNLNFRVGIIF